MKRSLWLTTLLACIGFSACGQQQKPGLPVTDNTLLWKISGKNLAKPSYLFGTMHMLCADDIALSENLKAAIKGADNIYLELELDNIFEVVGAAQNMAMKGDTTLADLLTKEEFEKVKNYFDENSSMLPFSMLQSYKPLLAASLIAEKQAAACDNMIAMEQLIMEEAKKSSVKIKGLETMKYQLAIFDQIPYKYQAEQLYQMIIKAADSTAVNEIVELTNAYRSQQLDKMEEMIIKGDMGIKNFTQILLYDRNVNWSKKLDSLLADKSLVIAVGAGHLPGKKGVISLLKQAGYKVEPVRNDMVKNKSRTI